MGTFRKLILALILTVLFGAFAFAAPGGPQGVIYYSDGLKFLKSKLYLSDGTLLYSTSVLKIPDGTVSAPGLAFAGDLNNGLYKVATDNWALSAGGVIALELKKTAGAYSNLGIGGIGASTSNSYPVLIERTLADALLLQISNPSSDAAASAKIQLSTDAGDKLGELGIFPNEATTAAYSGAMTVRPNGNSTRLSLIGGDLAAGYVTTYTAGDYTTAGEVLRINADKSLQLMQQIATPATPASGSAKLYAKAGDRLYMLDDNGVEGLLLTQTAPTAVKTTTYPIVANDSLVLVNGTSAFTTTLPTAVGVAGKRYTIKRVDETLANAVTIATTSSQTIDGVTTLKLMTKYEEFTVESDGSNWHTVSHTYPQGWTSFTPTGAWSTNTTWTGRWRRVGDSMELDVKAALAGAPDTATFTINIVTGTTIDTAKSSATSANAVGTVSMQDSGAGFFTGTVVVSSSSAVGVRGPTSALDGTAWSQASPITFANGDFITAHYMIPITNWEP